MSIGNDRRQSDARFRIEVSVFIPMCVFPFPRPRRWNGACVREHLGIIHRLERRDHFSGYNIWDNMCQAVINTEKLGLLCQERKKEDVVWNDWLAQISLEMFPFSLNSRVGDFPPESRVEIRG